MSQPPCWSSCWKISDRPSGVISYGTTRPSKSKSSCSRWPPCADVAEQRPAAGARRDEVHEGAVARPHRRDVLGRVLGEADARSPRQVVHPDLARARLGVDFLDGDEPSVGRQPHVAGVARHQRLDRRAGWHRRSSSVAGSGPSRRTPPSPNVGAGLAQSRRGIGTATDDLGVAASVRIDGHSVGDRRRLAHERAGRAHRGAAPAADRPARRRRDRRRPARWRRCRPSSRSGASSPIGDRAPGTACAVRVRALIAEYTKCVPSLVQAGQAKCVRSPGRCARSTRGVPPPAWHGDDRRAVIDRVQQRAVRPPGSGRGPARRAPPSAVRRPRRAPSTPTRP